MVPRHERLIDPSPGQGDPILDLAENIRNSSWGVTHDESPETALPDG
jgi:hypothetical protein